MHPLNERIGNMHIENSKLNLNLITFSELLKKFDQVNINGDDISMPISDFYKILQRISYLGYKEGIADASEQMKYLSETIRSEGSEDLYGEDGTEIPA